MKITMPILIKTNCEAGRLPMVALLNGNFPNQNMAGGQHVRKANKVVL
jgi:hypothetical protein